MKDLKNTLPEKNITHNGKKFTPEELAQKRLAEIEENNEEIDKMYPWGKGPSQRHRR